MAAAEVYIKELKRLKYGRPLYDPEDVINVGDVGFFERDSGNFRTLFNVFLDADHPFHAECGVPNGFVPLRLVGPDFTIKSSYFPPQAIKSKSVGSTDLDVQVPS
jgi:hypothetical protein